MHFRLPSPPIVLTGLLVLACGVRLIHWTRVDIWQDEANEIFIAEGTFGETLERIRQSEMRPPLRYYFLKVWLYGGRGTHYLRLPSLIFSIASVGLLYLAARIRFGEEVSVTAALLMAVISFPVSSAHFCRSYSMDAFVSVLAVHAFLCHLERRSSLHRIYFASAVLLAVYTTYFFDFILAVMLVEHVRTLRRGQLERSELWRIYLPIAILSIPLLLLAPEQLKNARAHRWHAAGADFYQLLEYFVVLGAGRIKNWDFSSLQNFVAILALFFAAVGSRNIVKSDDDVVKGKDAGLYLWWFAGPVAVIFLVSLFLIGLFTIRTMIVFAPAYYVLTAAGIRSLSSGAGRAAIVAFVAGANVYSFSTSGDLRYITNGSHKAGEFLAERLESGERVIHAEHFTYFPLRFYAPQQEHRILQSEVPWHWGRGQVPEEHLLRNLETARSLPGFWFVQKRNQYSMFADVEADYQNWLRQMAEFSAGWPAGDKRHGEFRADAQFLIANLCLTHYTPVLKEGALTNMDVKERLKARLRGYLKEGVYPVPVYPERALSELRGVKGAR